MKFTCEQERLNAALTVASRSVAQKNSNECLEGIFLEVGSDLQVTGYNLETAVVVSVSAQIERSGSIVVAARLFADIVRKLPKQEITLDCENLWITISCGASEFKIMGQDPSDYPELPDVAQKQGIVVQQSVLRNMINGIHFALSTNDTRPIHTGSLFEVKNDSLTLVALDGYRMAVRRENIDQVFGGPSFSFVVPGNSLGEVERICNQEEEVTISQSDNHILFRTDNISLICRQIDGEFMAYEGAIPSDNNHNIAVTRREFLSAIDRVSIMINEKAKAPLRCVFGKGMMDLSSKTTVGEAKDICPMDGDGENTEIGFNHRFLQDALRHAPNTAEKVVVAFSKPTQPCLILPETAEDKSFCYMVLPVRMKAGD